MYVLIAFFSAGSAYLRIPTLLGTFALICMQLDAQRGFFRALRPLPLSNKEQSNALWIIAVPLTPLLAVIPFTIGALASRAKPLITHSYNLPFQCALQAWLTLGYCALGFMLFMFLLNRRPVTFREILQQAFAGALWGTVFAGPQLQILVSNLPKAPSGILPWHWVLFSVVPIFVLGSFLAAPNIVHCKLQRNTGGTTNSQIKTDHKNNLHGLTGLPLFLVTLIGQILGIILLITVVQHGIWSLTTRGLEKAPLAAIRNTVMMVTVSMLLCTRCADLLNLRSLRILPIRTGALVALLAIIPVIGGISSAFLMNRSNTFLSLPSATELEFGGIVIGFGTFLLALNFQASGGWRIAVLMLAATAAPATLAAGISLHILLAGASVLGLLGYCGLYYGLKRSHSFYQSRQMFGIDPNNPMSA